MQQWASDGDLDVDKQQVWEKYIDNDKYDKLRGGLPREPGSL